MKRLFLMLATLAVLGPAGAQTLVWQDEFDGTAINTNHWTFDIGNGPSGWGNNELEYYTDRPENAFVSGGLLNIVARNESFGGANYTSARLKTQGLFTKKYGRFEFRVRLPKGQGYWPALWLWPADSVYGTWAASGEIDMLENLGNDTTTVYSALHYGEPFPGNVFELTSYGLPGGGSTTNFHVYAMEWTTNRFQWSVDGQVYQTKTNWYSSGGPYPAPFDQPFYIVMNLAVGGNFPGNPDGSTPFPGVMQVDYVRVYDFTAPPVRIDTVGVNPDQTQVTLVGTGPAGMTYHVLATTDPTIPLATWTKISTNQFSTVGTFTNVFSTYSNGVFYLLQTQ